MRLRINIVGATRAEVADGLIQVMADLRKRIATGTEESFEAEDIFYSAEFSELDSGDDNDADDFASLLEP